MKHVLSCLAVFLALSSLPVPAQNAAPNKQEQSVDDQSTYAADYKAAAQMQQALKDNDRQTVVNLIHFPLIREQPLLPIASASEFLRHWDEYFDAPTIKTLLATKAEQYGWRGIAMANGMVWFANGRVQSINSGAAAYAVALTEAKVRESRSLYPAARGYDSIAFQCNTKVLHVRVQYHGEDLRYFAWKRGAKLSTKPALELKSGVYDAQGSGGNHTISFNYNGLVYQLVVTHICGEDCNNYLIVAKGEKAISRQVCKEADQ